MDENIIAAENVSNEKKPNTEEELCQAECEEISEQPVKKKSAVKIIAVCLAVVLALCAVGATLLFVYKHKTSEADCTIFRNGLVPVMVDDKWGFANKKGEVVIKPQYDRVRSFCNGLAVVRKDDKWGYINTKGKIVIEPQFTQAGDFAKNGLAAVITERKIGYINKKGDYEINPQFDADRSWYGCKFSDVGLAVVCLDKKYGVINKKGEHITNFEYDFVQGFEENGTAIVELDDKYGLIDKEGNYIVYPEYDGMGHFGNSKFIPVEKDGKCGYIDKTGKLAIPLQFDNAGIFNNGLAAVKIGEKWGFINEKGKLVIKPQFKRVIFTYAFTSGEYAVVVKENESLAVIDSKGNYIIDNPEYKNIKIVNEMAAVFTENNGAGIINMKGEVVVEFGEYEWFWTDIVKSGIRRFYDDEVSGEKSTFTDGFIVTNDEKWGVLDKEGNVILEPIYNDVRYTKTWGHLMDMD